MFAQVPCLVLAVLAGVLCAPSPEQYMVGSSYGVNGTIGMLYDAKLKAALNDTRIEGIASGKIGLSGSGGVDGSVHAQYNDKIVERVAEYHGSAGGVVKGSAKAYGGQNAEGKMEVGSKGKSISSGEASGAYQAGIKTGQDALEKYYEHKQRTAEQILKDMAKDDDDEDF